MHWINVKDQLPELSYNGSDNPDHPYESYPVLLYCYESPGIQCVGYLIQNQNENDWNYGEYGWELYIPGNGVQIVEIEFKTFTHWMPLPESPKE